jgi:hypothetical protein
MMPTSIAALWFACRCFDIPESSIRPVKRQSLHLACKGGPVSKEKLQEIERKLTDTLFAQFRRQGIAHSGAATGAADSIVVTLLRIYDDLSPRFGKEKTTPEAALKIFVRDVALPTIHLILSLRQQGGLGSEFRRDSCWYVPQKLDGRIARPVALVLDRWLRAAGFRTAYGVSKPNRLSGSEEQNAKWESARKQVKRWLDGETTPPLKKLHSLVCKFPQNVAWLDTADSWCARFSLAYGLEKACTEIEGIFSAKTIGEEYRSLGREIIWSDDEGLLTNPSTFFAVRLWIRRLERTGGLAELRMNTPTSASGQFDEDVPDAEIERWKRDTAREMNFGNHIARHLLVAAGLPLQIESVAAAIHRSDSLRGYLFDFAADELNQLLRTKGHKGRKA